MLVETSSKPYLNYRSAVQQQLQNKIPSPADVWKMQLQDSHCNLFPFISPLPPVSSRDKAGELAHNIFFTPFLQQPNEKLHLLKVEAFTTSQTQQNDQCCSCFHRRRPEKHLAELTTVNVFKCTSKLPWKALWGLRNLITGGNPHSN